MVQQDLGACDKDRNISPHFPHTCWKIFNALSAIKTNEWIYNTENKWNTVKFAHMSNYSDLIGFTIFKCGSGYKNGLSDTREAVLFLIIPEMFPVSDRIPMTRRNLSRSPLCRIFVRRRFYPGLCLFLFLPPFSTGTALRRPYAVLMLPVKAQSFMATGNVRQGRSTNRPEHYGNFGCRQDLHENSRLGNIPVNSRVCRKSHVFAFSVLSHVRFFRHFHKACHIRRICRIVSQTISGDPSCAANMFPLLFGRQETACSSATSVRPVPRPINWRIISALPLWFPVSGPMLRLFHIVLVLGNRVKILKLPLYSI